MPQPLNSETIRSAPGYLRDIPSNSFFKDFCCSPCRAHLDYGMSPRRSQLGKERQGQRRASLSSHHPSSRFPKGTWAEIKGGHASAFLWDSLPCKPHQATASSFFFPRPPYNRHSGGLPVGYKWGLQAELELENVPAPIVGEAKRTGDLPGSPGSCWS